MDGNGRWAKEKGLDRSEGHRRGVETVKKMVEACGEKGIKFLTLYTFSMENWKRPQEEINILMALMVDAILREEEDLMKNNVVMKVIGDMSDMPVAVMRPLNKLIERTSVNTGVTVVLALSYGSRWEITNAAKRIAEDYKNGKISDLSNLDEAEFSKYLTTVNMPDPDLIIRTGGDYRLSNFLLWQSAYSEMYFIDKFWPDFEKEDLYLAIHNFATRERRFGMTGEQLKK
jgi:undecaprenyl diphosphate synthase